MTLDYKATYNLPYNKYKIVPEKQAHVGQQNGLKVYFPTKAFGP